MTEENLPPHLKIAASVTEEEYQLAKKQHRMLKLILIIMILVLSIPMVLYCGALVGIPAAIAAAMGVERILNANFKEARKANTDRMRRYAELRIYRAKMAAKEESSEA